MLCNLMPENQKVDNQSCDEQKYSRELVLTRFFIKSKLAALEFRIIIAFCVGGLKGTTVL